MAFNIINSLPLRYKLAALPMIMLGTLALVVTNVTSGIGAQRESATLINAAGRQRMLNQRFVKEVLQAAGSNGSTAAGETPAYAKTKKLFLNSLDALTNGGELIVNPGKGITTNIQAASDANLIKLLNENRKQALDLQSAANAYLSEAQSGNKADPSAMLTLNAQVHTKANSAVQRLVSLSNEKIDALIRNCIYISIIATLAAIFLCLLIINSIAHPVKLFRQQLNNAAAGDLSPAPTLNRKDEFGKMSTDLNQTLSAVSSALGSQSVSWSEVASLFTDMRASLQSVNAIVTQIPTTMLMLDNNGVVSYANPQAKADIASLVERGAFERSFDVGDAINTPQFGCTALSNLYRDKHVLPHKSIVQCGNEHLDIGLHALNDDTGARTGTLLSWQIVTDDIKQQQELSTIKDEEAIQATALITLVNDLQHTLESASSGDLTQRISKSDNARLNDIVNTVNAFIEQINQDLTSIRQRSLQLHEATKTLNCSSDHIDSSAAESFRKTNDIASDSDGVSSLMTSAAAATVQMSESIKNISTNTNSADQVSTEAVKLTENATTTVEQLFQSSTDIGGVVNFITSIAEQTNLLALNATIEAARAGDAGKGFGVVANEVKELAKQTATATDEISSRINSIQADSNSVVESISQLSGIVDSISEHQLTVAKAITEQTSVSKEISQTISKTSNNSNNIRNNIDDLVVSNQATLDSLQRARGATVNVMESADMIKELLNRYKLSSVGNG